MAYIVMACIALAYIVMAYIIGLYTYGLYNYDGDSAYPANSLVCICMCIGIRADIRQACAMHRWKTSVDDDSNAYRAGLLGVL